MSETWDVLLPSRIDQSGPESIADFARCTGMDEYDSVADALEDILAVPELGFVFLGMADLTISFSGGDPAAKNEDAIQSAVERTESAALAADVPLGRIQNDVEKAAQAVEDGYQIVRVGGDVSSMREVLGSRLETVRDR